MKPSPIQLRAPADKAVRKDLADVAPAERAAACRLMARAWLLALSHEETAEAAAGVAYRLADEFATKGASRG